MCYANDINISTKPVESFSLSATLHLYGPDIALAVKMVRPYTYALLKKSNAQIGTVKISRVLKKCDSVSPQSGAR